MNLKLLNSPVVSAVITCDGEVRGHVVLHCVVQGRSLDTCPCTRRVPLTAFVPLRNAAIFERLIHGMHTPYPDMQMDVGLLQPKPGVYRQLYHVTTGGSDQWACVFFTDDAKHIDDAADFDTELLALYREGVRLSRVPSIYFGLPSPLFALLDNVHRHQFVVLKSFEQMKAKDRRALIAKTNQQIAAGWSPSNFVIKEIVPGSQRDVAAENDQCVICQEVLLDADDKKPYVQLCCGHVFHKACWQQLAISHAQKTSPLSCPVCRESYHVDSAEPNEFHGFVPPTHLIAEPFSSLATANHPSTTPVLGGLRAPQWTMPPTIVAHNPS